MQIARVFRAAALGAVFLATLSVAENADDYRVWTSTSGSELEARLVFNYGDWVRLQKRDGAQVAIKTIFLSAADREFVRAAARLAPPRDATEDKKPDHLDINSASFDELKFLPRIGDTLAHRIIDGRPYRDTEELLDINGIGEKTFNGIKDDITARRPKRKRSGQR